MDPEFKPFTVPSFTPEQQQALHSKLDAAIFPNELEQDVGWSYGAPTWAVQNMIKEWLNYDFEEARKEMNQWHHYRTQIDGLKIHFVHEPSPQPDAIPILLLHGWPSSFYEFHKIIAPLRDGDDGNQDTETTWDETRKSSFSRLQAFHVVVPSLPGFGFSEAPKKPGYGVAKMAYIVNQLMIKLGYTRYVLHGGDWGAIIGKWIATRYSDHCRAFHTNLPFSLPPLPTPRNLIFYPFKIAKFFGSLVLGFDRVYGQGKTKLGGATFANAEWNYDCGYRAIQGTRPYTLAFGLTDSPIGLLAWLLEKYHEWTYHLPEKQDTEALPETITPHEFLTQVTLYWMTNTISSSIRIYYECLHQKEIFKVVFPRVKVPVAVCAFAHDISRLPRDWLETSTNLHQYSEMISGGHFPALEENTLLQHDLQRFGQLLKSKQLLP
ncbi:Alpha/Beta hydrolase protein [Radiomyces spectabilis]|uniref:Alpha/Beta hydrolase protein n=1 Tax=Radiomyces spectabilis TaxID=64574 RepID=UPI002220F4BE|nr:Alpha/Beta hydrolase protein [Radiomyces spectabilis]KAI8366048.1 Alpha/Beta hydrolase protein [Radiomyces spectabilis]